MAQKKERVEKVEETAQPPEAELTPTPEAQPQALTQEQIEATVAEAEQRGYGKAQEELQKEIERKEKVIQTLRERRKQPIEYPSQTGTDLFFAKEYIQDRERRARDLGEIDPELPALRNEIARREQMAYAQYQQAQWQARVAQEREKFDQMKEELGFQPDDPRLEAAEEAFEDAAEFTGKFDRAYKKLDRIPKAEKPKEAKKEETPKEEEIDEEKIRKYLEKKGMLKSDTGGPSARSQTWEQIRDAYIKNPNDPATRERYMQMRKERGK